MRATRPDYVFHTTCVGSTGELINEMQELAVDSTYRTLLKHCEGLVEFFRELGYGRDVGLHPSRDWAITWARSKYAGQPCYYFVWSHIEHIWLKRDCDWREVRRREEETRRPSNSLSPRGNPPLGALGRALRKLRPQLAAAAQAVVDDWQQDDEGFDEELGCGGCCDRVAQALGDVLAQLDVTLIDGGAEGDDHAFLLVYALEGQFADSQAYVVDIAPGVYETGGGYSWRKRPDVVIEAADVDVEPVGPVEDYLDERE